MSGDFELEAPPPAAAAAAAAAAEVSSDTKMDVEDDGATESKVAEPSAEQRELELRLQIANQKRLRIGDEGYIICICEVACLRMRQEQQLKCKHLLSKAATLVDTRDVDLLDASVNSVLHGSHASYFKKYGPPELFFKHALQYLAYTPLASLSTAAKCEWAIDLCLSALLGKQVYNFGSVLASPAASPILETLSGASTREAARGAERATLSAPPPLPAPPCRPRKEEALGVGFRSLGSTTRPLSLSRSRSPLLLLPPAPRLSSLSQGRTMRGSSIY